MPVQDSAQFGSDPFSGAPEDSLRVLQFTDTHLYADPDKRLLGVQTQRSLEDCVQLARAQHRQTDLVILSGDLVHDCSEAGYLRLRDTATGFGCPVCVLPGNHDDPAKLTALMGGAPVISGGTFRQSSWQVICLDSSVPASDAGNLDPVQLNRLEQQLARTPETFTLVTVHHPPVAIGSAWMDRIGLRNAAELFAILRGHDRVRAILCGHIHQELDTEHQAVRVLGTPSTCAQFKPRDDEFGVDSLPPGYRWLLLHANGEFETGVRRLSELPPGLELKSGGY